MALQRGRQPWILMQPAFRTADEAFRCRIDVQWIADTPDANLVCVEVTHQPSGELRALFVSSTVRRDEVAPALRTISEELLALMRRTGNPFDDLL